MLLLTAFFDDVQAHVSDVVILEFILVGVIADEDRSIARRYECDCFESQWEWWWCHDTRPWSEGASAVNSEATNHHDFLRAHHVVFQTYNIPVNYTRPDYAKAALFLFPSCFFLGEHALSYQDSSTQAQQLIFHREYNLGN